MRRIAIAALALTLVSSRASAQSPVRGTLEASASGAVSHLTDDESNVGVGGQLSGGLSYRLSKRLTVGVQVDAFRHTRHFESGVEFGATGADVMGQLVAWFRRSRVRPFVGVAAGFIHIRQHSRYPRTTGSPGVPATTGFDETSYLRQEAAWGGLGGVDFSVGTRAFVRPFAGLRVSRSFFLSIQYGLAAGWRW